MDPFEKLRNDLIRAVDSKRATVDGIAAATGMSPETVRSFKGSRTKSMKAHTRTLLERYLSHLQVEGSAPQHESATPRHIAGTGAVRFNGSASAATGRQFASEEERRGYMRRVLEEAQRAIADAAGALDAPLSAPVRDSVMESALDLAEGAVAAATQLSPDGTRG